MTAITRTSSETIAGSRCRTVAATLALCALVLGTIGLLPRSAGAQTPSPAVIAAVNSGAAAMKAGRIAEAEAAFRKAVALDPSVAETHLDLGLVLGREGRFDDATASVRQALALNPSLPSAHMFAGIFLSQGGHQDEAEKELRQETAANPQNVEAFTWLGTVEMAMSQPERAAAAFDRAAELTPNDLEILENQGRAHSEAARNSYAHMAKLDPDSWHVHRVQGELFAQERKHVEAIAEYEAAIKQMNTNPDLYEALGQEYRALQRTDAAQQAFTRELELGPANPMAMYQLGSIEIERGHSAEGVPLLQRMLTLRPHEPLAEYFLGRGLAAQGKDAEAALAFERSVADDRSRGEITERSTYELARVYRKLGRQADATRTLAEYNRLRTEGESRAAQQAADERKRGPSPAPANGTAAETTPALPEAPGTTEAPGAK